MSEHSGLEETRPTGHGRARGLVSSRTSGRRVDARTFAVPEDLRDIIATFWSGAWDLPPDEPHTTELLGDPSAHIVFEDSDRDRGGRIVGVWTSKWVRQLDGRGFVRGAKLRPGAIMALLAEPAHTITDKILPLSDVFEHPPNVLEEDEVTAYASFADFLRDRRRAEDIADVSLAVALMERVEQDLSVTSVAELCDVAGLSERPLQRLFRRHVGASPKWALMRRRIQEATLRLERGDHETVAELAAALHYADQAHFTRDFKRLVGCTPTEFPREIS